MDGKVALVTGGDYGIGRGISEKLIESGYSVVTFSNDITHAEALKEKLAVKQSQFDALTGDVSNADDVRRTVNLVMNKYGRIDLLCLTAGIKVPGDVVQTDEPTWNRVFDVNVKGVYLFCHEVVPHMIKQQSGVILTFSSPSANAESGHIAYAASKGAILSLSKSMAMDCRKHHIRVNTIIPGFTQSGMTENLPKELFEHKAGENVAGRVNTPEDIANMVLFLASEKAITMSGAVIDVGIVHGQMVMK